jgi:hypothetical protein
MTDPTPAPQSLREKFEIERRRSAFLAFLPAAGIGIIAFDMLISPWFGFAGGFLVGGAAYATVYLYESIMWRREHGQ